MELHINNLLKKFGQKIVLNESSFIFEEGKIYSVVGRNGAGKTTLFSCINGDLTFEGGEIDYIEDGAKKTLTFEEVGLVSASPVLPEFLTGYEFINFFIRLNTNKEGEKSIDEYFDLMKIEMEDRHKLIKNYSYGMKNKLQLLCCLIKNPKIILLDEPLSSFDIIVSHDIKETLMQMKEGHIILMATHIMQLAQDISDEVVLLRNGKLSGTPNLDVQSTEFEEFIIQALQEEVIESE